MKPKSGAWGQYRWQFFIASPIPNFTLASFQIEGLQHQGHKQREMTDWQRKPRNASKVTVTKRLSTEEMTQL